MTYAGVLEPAACILVAFIGLLKRNEAGAKAFITI